MQAGSVIAGLVCILYLPKEENMENKLTIQFYEGVAEVQGTDLSYQTRHVNGFCVNGIKQEPFSPIEIKEAEKTRTILLEISPGYDCEKVEIIHCPDGIEVLETEFEPENVCCDDCGNFNRYENEKDGYGGCDAGAGTVHKNNKATDCEHFL